MTAPPEHLPGRVTLHPGDCVEVLGELAENSIDACCCDPPYHLQSIVKRFGTDNAAPAKVGQTGAYARVSAGFMGAKWDGGDVAFRVETWQAVFRVLKPGAHLVAFGGTRTYHKMATAIEAAGFEVRDMISWLYGSGFPKSHDVSKGIDRAAGVEREVVGSYAVTREFKGCDYVGDESHATRVDLTAPATADAQQWDGWGTALKPACEPCVLARKPLSEDTVAANVLKWGTGALNIDGCRVGVREKTKITDPKRTSNIYGEIDSPGGKLLPDARWPANVIHDGSPDVVEGFPDQTSGGTPANRNSDKFRSVYGTFNGAEVESGIGSSEGSAARFFATFPLTEKDIAWMTNSASDAGEPLSLQSEVVVSVLTHAVVQLTPRLELQKQSYKAQSTNVTARELKLICASVTETIQNLERRRLLGLPPENVSARLDHVMCVAIPKPTGTTTITINLSKSGRSAEAITFNITATNEEVGEQAFASRFRYTSKADGDDRLGSRHPTIKPIDLIQYLVRLVTPPKGVVLDCFAGTGTTGEAAFREGMSAVLIEREEEYQADIRRRMKLAFSGPDERARETAKAKYKDQPIDHGPLFGGLNNAY